MGNNIKLQDLNLSLKLNLLQEKEILRTINANQLINCCRL